jgi:site-specific recombinase XerD
MTLVAPARLKRAIGQRHHRADRRASVIRRWHTASSRTMASKRRCRMTICSRSARRTMSSGSIRMGHDTRALQHYMGHKNIMHTVRYTEMAPDRFKNFWKD